jgi:hypothetical protein
MARFKITTTEGGEQLVTATRVRRDGDHVAFLTGSPHAPQVVHDLPAYRVAGIARRVTEMNGLQRWITEPVPAPGGPGGGAR